MRIADLNWMQVEEYLRRDDRCALPLGSTEQHAYLSLSVDSILAERVALEAAEPLGIPVFPAVSYGLTPYFRAYPGTVTTTLVPSPGFDWMSRVPLRRRARSVSTWTSASR